jgi:actin-related protein
LFHATVTNYQITRIKNDYLVAILVPLSWTKSMIEETAQFLFEVCNFSGIVFLEQPLTTLYGYGVTSGLVLDMGYDTCDIAAIFENAVVRYGAISLHVGGKDVLQYLQTLLLEDEEFKKVWKKDDIEEKFLKEILETPDLIIGLPNGETAATIIEINGLKVPISAKIRWSCLDVLFDPSKVGKELASLPQAIAECVRGSGEPDRRLFLWENIALSGGLAAISGIKNRIESECALYLAASETSSEFQAKEVGWLKIPDYFTNFRERPQDMGFVGGSVTARCTFLSPINYITRVSCFDLS